MSCIAEIYNDMKNPSNKNEIRPIDEGTISVKELKEKMIEHLTIDKFISYQNGNLVKIFEKNDKNNRKNKEQCIL